MGIETGFFIFGIILKSMKFSQPQTLEAIAAIIDCDYIGDAKFPVLGMNEIHVVQSGEIVVPPAPAAVTQIQPGTGADRIISWYGYELKLVAPNKLGIFLEGGGQVGVKTCGCGGGDGSCRAVVAETPHYSFCAIQRGDPCAGQCKFE